MSLNSPVSNSSKFNFSSSTNVSYPLKHPPQSDREPIAEISTRLPFDVWFIILAHAINIPYVFDVTCTSETAIPFRNAWSGKARADEYDKIIRTCRLVCKLWKEIADSYEVKWCRDPRFLHKDTRRLDIIEERWTKSDYHNLAKVYSDSPFPQRIETLSLSAKSTADPTSPFFLPIFQAISSGDSIRSLCLEVGCMGTTKLTYALSGRLPLLRSLSISTYILPGQLYFKFLQVLELRVSNFRSTLSFLPSLRHLFVHSDGNVFDWQAFFASHSSLRSLCFNQPLVNNSRFWKRHPELEFICAPTYSNWFWERLSPPPLDHPFYHWGLFHNEKYSKGYAHDIKQSPHRRFPNVKRLTIPNKYREMAEEEWVSLVHECSESGIVAVDEDGVLLQSGRFL